MNILFLCTHNACRSIIAEVITRDLAQDRLLVASAGSDPAGVIHPMTLSYLRQWGYDTANLASQALEAHRNFAPDVVISVCDPLTEENCPLWLGQIEKIHWGLPDPSHGTRSAAQVEAGFKALRTTLTQRIEALLARPFESMSHAQQATLLQQIGEHNGSV